jgi:hypothetical protein
MAGVTWTLGERDFDDGDILHPFFEYDPAQAGEDIPFDGTRGFDDDFGPSFPRRSALESIGDFDWTFTYSFPQEIASASITLGVFNHDSGENDAGSQVAAFSVDGHDLTALLDAQFEAYGGSDNFNPFIPGTGMEYNIYTVALPWTTFNDLNDGATFRLVLQNGYVSSFGNVLHNNAGLDFATLDIAAIPEPSSLFLISAATGLMIVGLGWRRRRRRSAPAECPANHSSGQTRES